MTKGLVAFAEIKTPPMGQEARRKTGFLLRMLQGGGKIAMPHSRPMQNIARGCHELRVQDKNHAWRVIYYVAVTELVVLHVFDKKTGRTPQSVIKLCKGRLKAYKDR